MVAFECTEAVVVAIQIVGNALSIGYDFFEDDFITHFDKAAPPHILLNYTICKQIIKVFSFHIVSAF